MVPAFGRFVGHPGVGALQSLGVIGHDDHEGLVPPGLRAGPAQQLPQDMVGVGQRVEKPGFSVGSRDPDRPRHVERLVTALGEPGDEEGHRGAPQIGQHPVGDHLIVGAPLGLPGRAGKVLLADHPAEPALEHEAPQIREPQLPAVVEGGGITRGAQVA